MGRGLGKVALFAECSSRIGTGHVAETLSLITALGGLRWHAWLGPQVPLALLSRFSGKASRIDSFSPRRLAQIGARLRADGFSAAVLNLLRATDAQARALRGTGLRVACLTAAGPAPKSADAGLSYDTRFWTARDGGPAWMCLNPVYSRLGQLPRRYAGPVREVLIIMGGTDSSGTTVAIVRALRYWRPEGRKHVVAGSNFMHKTALAKALKPSGPSFVFHRTPPNLPHLMRRCDAALTYGSDTSLELACVGTPMLLFHEAPHEARQAMRLAKAGCGLLVGSKATATRSRLTAALAKLDDPRVRARMAAAGRRVVDGRGAQRLATLVRSLTS